MLDRPDATPQNGIRESPSYQRELEETFELLYASIVRLRSIHLEDLSKIDIATMRVWRDELRIARGCLGRVLEARGETPQMPMDRETIAPFSPGRMKLHLHELADELGQDLDSISAAQPQGGDTSPHLLGLYFKILDVFRFFDWLGQRLGAPTPPVDLVSTGRFQTLLSLAKPVVEAPESSQAPATPPQPKKRYDVNVRQYDDHPEESGDHLRHGSISVWHARHEAPRGSGLTRSLDMTSALPIRDGVVFGLADGVRLSPGARVASALAARSFTELLSSHYTALADARALISNTTKTVRQHLESLLRALLASADDSGAMTVISGDLPVRNVRSILEHTLAPDPRVRYVQPALALSFLGGLMRLNPERGIYELYFLKIGDCAVERKCRRRKADSLTAPGVDDGGDRRLSAGPNGSELLRPSEVKGPFEVTPGEAILIASGSLRRGHSRLVWDELEEIGAGIDPHWGRPAERGLTILRHAARVSDAVSKHGRDPLFPEDLSLVLLSLDERAFAISPPDGLEKRVATSHDGDAWKDSGTIR